AGRDDTTRNPKSRPTRSALSFWAPATIAAHMEWLLISLASLLAGFVDSIVGGGGLILLPAMFAIFPNTQPATLFGINKGAAILGTAAATAQFARRVQMPWRSLLPAAALAFAG